MVQELISRWDQCKGGSTICEHGTLLSHLFSVECKLTDVDVVSLIVFQGLLAANRLPAHLTAARNEYVPPTKKPAGKLLSSVKNLVCPLA